jgi:RNA polymerase sigma-70 factor (ECF subfamily)
VALSGDSEALGLLALMLLHSSRSATRVDAMGELVLLEQQERSRWDRAAIAEAQAIIERALAARVVGPFLLQAAIAAVHAEAPSEEATVWAQIVGLYDSLLRVDPSPIVALNRAAAVGMRDGALAGLAAIEAVSGLEAFAPSHAARGEFQRRLGQIDAARQSFARALALTTQPAERRFLQRQLGAC